MEGIYSIPYEQYDAVDAVSKHGLDSLAISPLHHWQWHRNPDRIRKPDTPAKLLGNAIHTSILEPERFESEYIEEPQPPEGTLDSLTDLKEECKKRELAVSGTKSELAHRLIMAGFDPVLIWDRTYPRLTKGKKVLSTPDWRVVKGITAKVRKHPAASELFKYGKAEQSIFWTDKETGVQCKGRIDWLCLNNLIVDLKSTQDASPDGFQRSIVRYRYYVQAAMYSDGLSTLGYDPEPFIFAAWEKHSPYASALYYATKEMIQEGRQEYRKLLRLYRECLEDDRWPGYHQDILPIDLPVNYKSEASPESELEDDWLESMGTE